MASHSAGRAWTAPAMSFSQAPISNAGPMAVAWTVYKNFDRNPACRTFLNPAPWATTALGGEGYIALATE